MHALNVKLSGAEGVMTLFYDDAAEAKAAGDALANADQHACFCMEDRHGNTLRVIPRNVLATFVVDLAKDIARQQEMTITQMREQAKLQTMAQSDPKLRFMAGMQGANLTGFRQQ